MIGKSLVKPTALQKDISPVKEHLAALAGN